MTATIARTELEPLAAEDAIERMPTPMDILNELARARAEPAQLKEAMDLCTRWNAEQSAIRYGEAIAGFQAECPQIVKTKAVNNKDGSLRYHFAPFEEIDRIVRPFLKANRIGVSFEFQTKDGLLQATWHIQVGAHKQARQYSMPSPDYAKLAADCRCNEPQAQIVATSYFKRNTFCAALGVVCTGEDSDGGRMLESHGITEEQAEELEKLLKATKANMPRFFVWASEAERRPITALKELSLKTWTLAKQDAEARMGKEGAA